MWQILRKQLKSLLEINQDATALRNKIQVFTGWIDALSRLPLLFITLKSLSIVLLRIKFQIFRIHEINVHWIYFKAYIHVHLQIEWYTFRLDSFKKWRLNEIAGDSFIYVRMAYGISKLVRRMLMMMINHQNNGIYGTTTRFKWI